MNIHLMSDQIKIRIGKVSQMPIEKEEDIQDVGYTMVPWKDSFTQPNLLFETNV
tara:strand:+ start:709 stop:870 length:162 start_codon:yes stop_codon:yes gene_type:complete